MLSQVAYPDIDCLYGIDVGVATEKMTDNLVLNTIIFRCEGERSSPRLIEFGIIHSV